VIDETYERRVEHAPPSYENGRHVNGPRIPRRAAWFTLPDEYGETEPPMQAKLWVSYPHRLMDDIRSGDPELQLPALRKIVLEHNGWIDEDGQPLPIADSDEFWERIPDVLLSVLIAIVGNEIAKTVASVTRKQRR
jgi:hypothetical protein